MPKETKRAKEQENQFGDAEKKETQFGHAGRRRRYRHCFEDRRPQRHENNRTV